MSSVGKRLKEEINRLGLKSNKFSELVKVSSRTQSLYENDHRKPDSGYFQIASELGIDVHYVLTGERTTLVESSTGEPPAGDALLSTLELIRKYTETAINLRKQQLEKKD